MDEHVHDLIAEALAKLKGGETEAAILVLERTLWPKFDDEEHARGAYEMFNPDGPQDRMRDFFAKALGHQIAAVS